MTSIRVEGLNNFQKEKKDKIIKEIQYYIREKKIQQTEILRNLSIELEKDDPVQRSKILLEARLHRTWKQYDQGEPPKPDVYFIPPNKWKECRARLNSNDLIKDTGGFTDQITNKVALLYDASCSPIYTIANLAHELAHGYQRFQLKVIRGISTPYIPIVVDQGIFLEEAYATRFQFKEGLPVCKEVIGRKFVEREQEAAQKKMKGRVEKDSLKYVLPMDENTISLVAYHTATIVADNLFEKINNGWNNYEYSRITGNYGFIKKLTDDNFGLGTYDLLSKMNTDTESSWYLNAYLNSSDTKYKNSLKNEILQRATH